MASHTIEEISRAWEASTGCDSIPTIVRVYSRTPSGAYRCIRPGCKVARHDPAAMWHHVHSSPLHPPGNYLPPEDFDPEPWL